MVKLLIRESESGEEIVTNALVNSGFETLTIKILIPKNLANELVYGLFLLMPVLFP